MSTMLVHRTMLRDRIQVNALSTGRALLRLPDPHCF